MPQVVEAHHVTTPTYNDYIFWRKQGLRACIAFGVAKYGLWFFCEYLKHEERKQS